MKPENISDVLENISNLSREVLNDTEARNQVLHSQIEQLLGMIDTGKKSNLITEKRRLTYSDVDEAYNQKSSEIANQIKLIKQ